jgi:hypothetical protein
MAITYIGYIDFIESAMANRVCRGHFTPDIVLENGPEITLQFKNQQT